MTRDWPEFLLRPLWALSVLAGWVLGLVILSAIVVVGVTALWIALDGVFLLFSSILGGSA